MADYGIKASTSGDVKTATVADLSFTSMYKSPKLQNEHFGVYTHTFPSAPPLGTTVLKTIAHGYSYVPAAIVFVIDHQNSDQFGGLPVWLEPSGPLIHYYTNSTNLIIYYFKDEWAGPTDPTGYSYTFKYIILADDGD